MFKILFLLFIIHMVQNVLTCKWVCIDKNHNIKKQFIHNKKFNLDYQNNHEINIVPGQDKKIKFNTNDVIFKNPEMFVEPTQDMCSTGEAVKTIKEMAKRIKCRPRETIVSIQYKGKKVIPNKIATKLCSGFCSGSKSCMPTETKNVSLPVSIPNSSSGKQCSIVFIPQDIKCKCGCDRKAFKCSSKQSFNKKFCKCKCKNENEYQSCINKMNNDVNIYYWNTYECLCKCKFEYICSTGSKWDHNTCKCIRPAKE